MTTEQTWATQDKSGWPAGPWHHEPDKVVWVDDATGLDCMIHRGPSGALCGYVGVGPDHPWHGKGYSESLCEPPCQEEREWSFCEHSPSAKADVHGGLTYAEPCDPDGTEAHGICHVPQPGRPHGVWWFGFDCAHAGDVTPAHLRFERERGYDLGPDHSVYRTVDYLRREVAALARQLAAPEHVDLSEETEGDRDE